MRLLLYVGFDQAHVERGSAHCQYENSEDVALNVVFHARG